jgi:hypothetical protein
VGWQEHLTDARDDELRIAREPETEAPVPAPRARPERVGEDDWDERPVLEGM